MFRDLRTILAKAVTCDFFKVFCNFMHTNTNTVVNLCVDVFNIQEYTGCGRKKWTPTVFRYFLSNR